MDQVKKWVTSEGKAIGNAVLRSLNYRLDKGGIRRMYD
jgi:hypothetical protein